MSLLFGDEKEKLKDGFYDLVRKIKNAEDNYDELMLDCLKIVKQYRTIPLQNIDKQTIEMYNNFFTASKKYSTKFSLIYKKHFSNISNKGNDLEMNKLDNELEEVIKSLKKTDSQIASIELNVRVTDNHEKFKALREIMKDLTDILEN